GRPRDALKSFARYLELKGKPDVELYRRRARARASAGDLAGVVDEYTAALALVEDGKARSPLLAARGWAHLVNGASKPAVRNFDDALRRDAGNSNALVGRGTARVELGEVGAGIADAEAALKLGPHSSRLSYNAARVLARAAGIETAARRGRAHAER